MNTVPDSLDNQAAEITPEASGAPPAMMQTDNPDEGDGAKDDRSISERLHIIGERIACAAQQDIHGGGHKLHHDVTLVAVSKTVDAPRIVEAVQAGVTNLGENRVQEATDKIPLVRALLEETGYTGPAPRWHLIGRLQSNKVKQAVALFDVIQSIDSLELAELVDRHAALLDRHPTLLFQVNIAAETTKGGFSPQELRAVAGELAELTHVTCAGLMTIAPFTDDLDILRPTFDGLRELYADLAPIFAPEGTASTWTELSMGMSGDFETAIACGATMVRIGRAIFGERVSSESTGRGEEDDG